MSINLFALQEPLLKMMTQACELILAVYNTDFDVITKGDGSPVTVADKLVSQHLISELENLTPNCLVISEELDESHEYETRKKYENVWIIDPLDGTKGFVAKNDEFAICVGLSHNGIPVAGLLGIPIQRTVYYTFQEKHALKRVYSKRFAGFTETALLPFSNRYPRDSKVHIIVSTHSNKETDAYIQANYKDYSIQKVCSALKFGRMLDGLAEVYPRLKPCYEWDTCAGHALLRSLGGKVKDLDGNELKYNKQSLLNPDFVATLTQ